MSSRSGSRRLPAVEAALRDVKAMIYDRRFCFRNGPRTNQLLELMRAHLNKEADERAYAVRSRQFLRSDGGQLGRQLAVRDPRGYASLRR